MNEFKKVIRKWNNGLIRGSQTRLAKALRVDQATVSRWVSGEYSPDPDIAPRLAKMLKVSPEELAAMFADMESDNPSSIEELRNIRESLIRIEKLLCRLDGLSKGKAKKA